jgi:hypothetical protein
VSGPRPAPSEREAEYKALADRFRRGERLTGKETARLRDLALIFRNYRLAESTSTDRGDAA